MAKDINQAVREVCLSFPEAEEYLSHGSPNFRVRGKTFATYVVNHHGDGRVALWLNASAGAQEHYTGSEARHFFVPPYVGPRGWLGVSLAYYLGDRLKVAFWVGVDRQGLLTADSRYAIPAYIGHNGWIALDVTEKCHWDGVRALALDSYRHFALKRMRGKLVQGI